MAPSQLYYYKAYVTRVHSGDTCRVDLDLGMGIWTRGLEIRLHRVKAPEVKRNNRTAGVAARDYLRGLILDREVLLRTIKDRKDKPSRYLGEMRVVTETGETINVNEDLVKAGHAEYQDPQPSPVD
ncbi:MAG: thermonuclease family protein [Fidelibacterota bacterium]|nr:MAG: thermonuclease family protein [Candidatus Neomarinimicrobiota bacterium]